MFIGMWCRDRECCIYGVLHSPGHRGSSLVKPCGMMVVGGGGEGGVVKVWTCDNGRWLTVSHYYFCRGMCIDARKCIYAFVHFLHAKAWAFGLHDVLFLGHVDYCTLPHNLVWFVAGELQHSFSLPQSSVISSISHHPSLRLLAVSSLSYHHPVSFLIHHQAACPKTPLGPLDNPSHDHQGGNETKNFVGTNNTIVP